MKRPTRVKLLSDDRGPIFAGPPRPTRSVQTVLFDLETQRSSKQVGGWDKSYRMLVAVGVVCHLQDGRFETFFEDRTVDLIERLDAADLVVGFNIKRFDYQVLEGYTGIDYNRKLPTLDLLEDVHRQAGFRISMRRARMACRASSGSKRAVSTWSRNTAGLTSRSFVTSISMVDEWGMSSIGIGRTVPSNFASIGSGPLPVVPLARESSGCARRRG
jgi:hypothetical protein